ncbi:hypothetical protein H2248_011075 [Termitomyces sp. 'cryptogamus']|nr:hypothetical protein H2248_011075 [Termitomyces sp. 'cryptogamus']
MAFIKLPWNSPSNTSPTISWTSLVIVLCLACLLHFALKWLNLRKSMPPGPLGIPFIGNMHQMPKDKPWLKFLGWSRQYGPVVSIFLGSTPVIVLGTAQAAWDLLEKRSEFYSSRPRSIFMGELLSGGKRGLLRPNDDKWRRWRKILHSSFHYQMAQTYQDLQSLESKISLCEILEAPQDYVRHLQRFAASVITTITYGVHVKSLDDWIVKENMDTMNFFRKANVPGKFLVEGMPWLLKLPRRLQWFRRVAEERRHHEEALFLKFLNDARARMKNGTMPDSLSTRVAQSQKQNGMTDLEMAYTLASSFGAGFGTTSASLETFILIMLHFPDTMRKAQAELDRVVGSDRMPEYYDKESLPYTNALIKETMRWRPVAAFGAAPHAVTVDDEYRGMFIPKGATLYANIFGIMHDPEMFPSPDDFRPERFLETQDPRLQTFDLPFGFGRRICPGMHLARNSIFINIARMLWAFNILPALAEDGQQIIPDSCRFTTGITSKPLPFKCRFISRNEKIAECIKEEARAAREKFGS